MTTGNFYFATRDSLSVLREINPEALFLDSSSKSEDIESRKLSPFYFWRDNPIPVPGYDSVYSYTVEGIWQGLKLIDGKTDFNLFDSEKIKKRVNKPYDQTKFDFGEVEIGLLDARNQIYVPSYKFMFNNNLNGSPILGRLEEAFASGRDVYIYDVDGNSNLEDISRSYSHSALLIKLLKERFHPNL